MKLVDARRIAIRSQVDIRFPLSNGMECVIDRHGIARVPGIQGALEVNLEEEFERSQVFWFGAAEVSRTALEQMGKTRPEEVHPTEE
jgi:hypothetical protein